jgi:translation initiation factor 3 subunit C
MDNGENWELLQKVFSFLLSKTHIISITMSRFFQGSDSDTDSSSSSDEEIYSDQEDEEQSDDDLEMDENDEDESEAEGSGEEDEGAQRRNIFLRGAVSDESDEEEGKRVVRSAKDKRLQEIEATTKLIENGGKINDWVVISNGIRISYPMYTDLQNLKS